VLRIGVGGCSILGRGHRPCAVLVCYRRLFSGGADRGVSGHICVAGVEASYGSWALDACVVVRGPCSAFCGWRGFQQSVLYMSCV
jgi:hypothetical protein